MKKYESDEQIAVVTYCEYRKIPVFHIPNGGSRNKIEAANLKKQGVRAGVPDLCIPVSRKGYHGLFIEMKAGRNKATETQKQWIELLNKNGYLATVCNGAGEAINTIENYFSNEKHSVKPTENLGNKENLKV